MTLSVLHSHNGHGRAYEIGQYVLVKSPAGVRRLARIVSDRPEREPRARRGLWLVRTRNSLRWTDPEWLPVERALLEGELELQRRLGFIDERGEPS